MSAISTYLPAPPDRFSTTLSAGINATAVSIAVNSVSGLPTEGVGVIFAKDTAGVIISSSIEFIHWTNISGSNLTLSDTNDRGIAGSTSGAQAHSSGDYFEVWQNSHYYTTLRAGGVVEHGTDGKHSVPLGQDLDLDGNSLLNAVLDNPEILDTVVFDSEVDNGNSGASKTVDWTTGNKQKVTLTGNCTFTFTPPAKPCNIQLRCIADGTVRTITWPAAVKWAYATAPTMTGTNGRWDIISFYFDGTNYSGVASQNFA